MLEQPVPEGLHPMKRDHAGAVCKGKKPMGRTHIEKVCRGLFPVEICFSEMEQGKSSP